MKAFLTALAFVFGAATAAQATTVTVGFAGLTSHNPGLPGNGSYFGEVTYSTDGATHVSGGLFTSVITEVDINVSGTAIQSAGAPTLNTFNQVQLVDGRDAFFGTYAGSFGATGVPGIAVESVYLELRMDEAIDVFSSESALFDALSDGQVFDINAVDYISLVIEYVGAPFSDSTILRLGTVDTLTIAVANAPAAVPLPAGLPLLLTGLGGIALLRRRRRA